MLVCVCVRVCEKGAIRRERVRYDGVQKMITHCVIIGSPGTGFCAKGENDGPRMKGT